MNILLFVMTMLMLLTMMTYGRIESYRGFVFMKGQFKEYMEKTERLGYNQEVEKRYEREKGSKKNGSESGPKNKASSNLSFNLFVDKEEREKQAAAMPTQMMLAKNLMHFLYGDQPFFVEMEEKRPTFLDEIFAALIKVTSEYSKEKKLNLKKAEEIATVDLGDIELNEAFTKMLRGSIKEGENAKGKNFKPLRGYYPLIDFLTLDKNKLKIRVFLASPQLLMAIYGNPDLVRQILDVRKNLYNDLAGKRTTQEQGSQVFQSQFQGSQLSSIPETALDYGISKTRPKN